MAEAQVAEPLDRVRATLLEVAKLVDGAEGLGRLTRAAIHSKVMLALSVVDDTRESLE